MAVQRALLVVGGTLAASLSLFQPCMGQECEGGDLEIKDPELAAKLQAHLDSVSQPFVGTALAVSIAGVGVWRGAHGYSHWEEKTPMLPDDRFRIASNTKTFVTAVILQLDQEGALKIEDRLEKWVPGYFDDRGITLRNLIQHTSGIYNYTDAFWFNVVKTPEEIVEYASKQPMLFQPGQQWSYSNTNFVLLGMVIKAVTGSGWEVEVRKRLLDPLGLSNTYVEGLEEPLAGGYVPGYAQLSPTKYVDVTSQVHYSVAGAAGSMISNTRDLLRWLEALTSGEVMDGRHLEAMVTPFPISVGTFATPRLGEQNRYGYGFGLQLEDIRLGPSLGHTGGIDAFTSVMMYFPEVGIGVAGWVNTRNYDYDVFDTFLPAAQIAFDHCSSIGCPLRDADRNGELDRCDIAAGTGHDCNLNGALDQSDLAPGPVSWSLRPTRHATGAGPLGVVVADLDGDADLDLATPNRTAKSVSVLRNGGGATFAIAEDHALGVAATALAAIDIDGDHDLDLAAASAASKSVSLLVNEGNASFAEAVAFDMGRAVNTITGGDLDQDGDADLVATDTTGKAVLVVETGSALHLEAPVAYTLTYQPRALLLVDVDLDGALDIAVTGFDSINPGGVELLRNDGNGTFADGGFFRTGRGTASLEGGDLDGDGDPDLVAGNAVDYTLTVLQNDASGGFSTLATLSAGLFPPNYLKAMDVDADGDMDLCIGAGDEVTIRRNDGEARFPLLAAAQASFGLATRSIAGGDLNGDGLQDLACLLTGAEIGILLNATAPPASADCNSNGVPDECDLASGAAHDADGDGALDECHPRPRFHRGDPNSSGTTDLSDGIYIFSFLFLGGDSPSCMESADVNNDANVDISDGIQVLNYLFLGAQQPAPPGPTGSVCGPDVDEEGSPGDLGCSEYPVCGGTVP